MSRPLLLPQFFQEVDFKVLYKKHGQKQYGLRLLALYYLQAGQGVKEVASKMKKTQLTIRRWVRYYAEGGLEGILSIRAGRGRRPKLKRGQEEEFKSELCRQSASLRGGRLRAFEIGKMLERKFDIRYSGSGVYALLHRLGYSWITSRSIHPKGDPKVQEKFKKGVSETCKKTAPRWDSFGSC